jgi:hypothetical protein
MVGLMNKKDFYINTHFICGVNSSENIFDLPDSIFDYGNVLCFETAIKNYIKPLEVKMNSWPWMWETSSLTDEVFIYDIETERTLYYVQEYNEFFDARLVREKQHLRGCEIFDFTFNFPKMSNLPSIKLIKGAKSQDEN